MSTVLKWFKVKMSPLLGAKHSYAQELIYMTTISREASDNLQQRKLDRVHDMYDHLMI